MKNFWDFCAPFYDMAEKRNAKAYGAMIKTVRDATPDQSSVLEIAAGTGSITLGLADKVRTVLCTDISEKMLLVARKKAAKRNFNNVSFDNVNIFEIPKPDNTFDVVIASQVLHLIDEPKKAASEMRRVSKNMVIMPMSFTENLKGRAKMMISVYRLAGFNPKREFNSSGYAAFLSSIGFENCRIIPIDGVIPMAVAVWEKAHLS